MTAAKPEVESRESEYVTSRLPQGGQGGINGDPAFLYVLRHADDNLVVAQRMAEIVSRAPELETDIALANIALDHLGVARSLLAHAGALEGAGRNEDHLGFLRDERAFTNLLLVEQPNTDFGHTITRQLFFDTYQLELWEALGTSNNSLLAGVAAKALKEARYHFRFSSTWVIRLGDGTEESHHRMQTAIDHLWRFTHEMFIADPVDETAARTELGIDPGVLRPRWDERIHAVLEEATLDPPTDPYQRIGGRAGFHTEHLGLLLAEMQWMQRSFPGLAW